MSYSAPSGGTEFTKRFQIEIVEPKAIPLGQVESNAEELFKVEYVPQPGVTFPGASWIAEIISGTISRISGTAQVRASFQSSDDGISWDQEDAIAVSGGGPDSETNAVGLTVLLSTRKFLRLALFSTVADSVGSVKNLKWYIELVVPQGVDLVRLV